MMMMVVVVGKSRQYHYPVKVDVVAAVAAAAAVGCILLGVHHPHDHLLTCHPWVPTHMQWLRPYYT